MFGVDAYFQTFFFFFVSGSLAPAHMSPKTATMTSLKPGPPSRIKTAKWEIPLGNITNLPEQQDSPYAAATDGTRNQYPRLPQSARSYVDFPQPHSADLIQGGEHYVVVDDDRLSDDYATRGGGKKRKVPSSAQNGPTIAVSGESSLASREHFESGRVGHRQHQHQRDSSQQPRSRPSCMHSCGHACGAEVDETDDFENQYHDHDHRHEDGNDNDKASADDFCCEYHAQHHQCGSGGEYDDDHDRRPSDYLGSRATEHRRAVPKRKWTPSRTAIAFEKKLYNARRSQVLGLHADAIACLSQSGEETTSAATDGGSKVRPPTTSTKTNGKANGDAATLPDIAIPSTEELEDLVQALEYAGVTGWEGDRVGAGAGMWEGFGKGRPGSKLGTGQAAKSFATAKTPSAVVSAEANDDNEEIKLRWRKTGKSLERELIAQRKPIKRGGWTPEGSFEFELPSPVSKTIRQRHSQLVSLRNKVTQLLTLTLTSSPMSSLLSASTKAKIQQQTHQHPPQPAANKTKPPPAASPRRSPTAPQNINTAPPAKTDTQSSTATAKTSHHSSPKTTQKTSPDIVVEPSADDPNYVPPAPNKGKKKKKRSAAANAANPHHVKNCEFANAA